MKGSSRSFYIIAVFYLPPSLSHASAPLQLVTSLIPCSPLVSMNNTYASRQGVVFTDFVLKAKYSAAGEQVNTCLSKRQTCSFLQVDAVATVLHTEKYKWKYHILRFFGSKLLQRKNTSVTVRAPAFPLGAALFLLFLAFRVSIVQRKGDATLHFICGGACSIAIWS